MGMWFEWSGFKIGGLDLIVAFRFAFIAFLILVLFIWLDLLVWFSWALGCLLFVVNLIFDCFEWILCGF